MTEHTPGPWEAQGATVYQIDGFGLCYLEGYRAEADAYLIAAAPDLLEALEHLLLDYESEWGSELVDYEYADVRAAVAKARGEWGK